VKVEAVGRRPCTNLDLIGRAGLFPRPAALAPGWGLTADPGYGYVTAAEMQARARPFVAAGRSRTGARTRQGCGCRKEPGGAIAKLQQDRRSFHHDRRGPRSTQPTKHGVV